MPKVYHSDSEDSLSDETDITESEDISEDSLDYKRKRKPAAKQRKPVKKSPTLKRKQPSRDKNAPKKPITAYLAYRNANITALKEANPKTTFSEHSKKLSEMWKELSHTEKEPFLKIAEEDKRRYEKELANYTPSDDEDEDIDDNEELDDELEDDDEEDDLEDRRIIRGPRKKRAKKDKKEGPKRPLNAYLIFVNNERAGVIAQNPKWKITEVVRHLGSLWKNLSEAEKQVYTDRALQEKERYEKEMKEFNATKAATAKEENPVTPVNNTPIPAINNNNNFNNVPQQQAMAVSHNMPVKREDYPKDYLPVGGHMPVMNHLALPQHNLPQMHSLKREGDGYYFMNQYNVAGNQMPPMNQIMPAVKREDYHMSAVGQIPVNAGNQMSAVSQLPVDNHISDNNNVAS
jgi:high mobility group protein B2